jgi:hypothetical protein
MLLIHLTVFAVMLPTEVKGIRDTFKYATLDRYTTCLFDSE